MQRACYDSDEALVAVSLKLTQRMPQDLPPNMMYLLRTWLQCAELHQVRDPRVMWRRHCLQSSVLVSDLDIERWRAHQAMPRRAARMHACKQVAPAAHMAHLNVRFREALHFALAVPHIVIHDAHDGAVCRASSNRAARC